MFCECLFAFSYLQNIRRYQQKNVHRSTQKALRNSPEGFDAAKQNLCNLARCNVKPNYTLDKPMWKSRSFRPKLVNGTVRRV